MSDLNFNQYDETAKKRLNTQKLTITYTAFGLSNEAGEVLGKLKKLIRDHDDFKTALRGSSSRSDRRTWRRLMVSLSLSSELGTSLEEVARSNNAKLLTDLHGKIKGLWRQTVTFLIVIDLFS